MMPELPEMEHYRRMLEPLLAGHRITGAEIGRERSVNLPVDEFARRVTGRSVQTVGRRAKHLIFALEDGSRLLLHLMLGGWMFFGAESERPDRTIQVRLSFGTKHLYFIGLRLGFLHWLTAAELEERLSALGPEPTDADWSEASMLARYAHKKGNLKSLLVDQHLVAGIGNCYADEICFEAGLRPDRRAQELTSGDWSRLYRAMRPVLDVATAGGGYMEHPLTPGDKLTGAYGYKLSVYDRGGDPCLRCGTPITKTEVSGRKCFFCPNCQR